MPCTLVRLTNGIRSRVKSSYMAVPVTSSMLRFVLNKKRRINQINVFITNEQVIISGKVCLKKVAFLHAIPFRVTLKPLWAEGRRMAFQLVKLRPVNIQFITKRVLTKSFLKYEKSVLYIDLNQIRPLNRIPIGKLKGIMLKDEIVYVWIGI
ncbi:hypothetical protein [Aquibacillus sediminis]|uniref:hypothetical protein n=1 Tax=Aquibacillus sediminis TaxID=2574734 RepID=UPI001107F4B7|nr:hypothetical protein [Aquibacillus sediminis]